MTKAGAGNWLLGENTTFGEKARFTINEGTLDLGHKRNLTLGKDSIFTLGSSDKDSTIIARGNNKINAVGSDIVFNTGNASTSTTLALSLTDANKITVSNDANEENAALTLHGNVRFEGANALNLDISGYKAGAGLYSLIYTSEGNQLDLNKFNMLENQRMRYNGESISNIERLAGLSLVLNSAGNALILNAEGAAQLTHIATWTNAEKDNLWSKNGNWSTVDSADKKIASSIFINGDFAQFNSKEIADQQIKIDTVVDAAGIYISGDATYLFESDGVDGFNITEQKTTFNDEISSGKLVLGQEVVRAKDGSLETKDASFNGTLDLTRTANNDFSGGIDIYSGTLRISHSNQLGQHGNKHIAFEFAGNNGELLIADGADVTIINNELTNDYRKAFELTINEGNSGQIKTEGDGKLTFKGLNEWIDGSLKLQGSEGNLINLVSTDEEWGEVALSIFEIKPVWYLIMSI